MGFKQIDIIGDTARLDTFGDAAIFSTRSASIFVEETALAESLQELVSINFRIINVADADISNPHANCAELWKHERIGRFIVIPVSNGDDALPLLPLEVNSEHDIPLYIIPGMGFGTGHHPTTHSVLEVLQTKVSENFERAIDIGTGSGLLAIGIAKLFNIPVDGYDNDAAAVDNAFDNVRLNSVSHLVTLQTASVGTVQLEPAPLVCANLYSELLIDFSENITQSVLPGGTLILSGITESRGPAVIATFRERGFVLVLEQNLKGWMTFLFVR